MGNILIKRVYETPEKTDGYRILVDRIWPRGISKTAAKLDEWAKNMAPSTQLRKMIHSNLIDWEQFEFDYKNELYNNENFKEWQNSIYLKLAATNVTFVTSAKLTPINHVKILKDVVTHV